MAGRTALVPQLFGLGVTLAAVAIYFGFTFDQVGGLQRLQTEIVDRNRRDSLQLIRIQNNLYQIGLTLREATESGDQYPLTGYHSAMQALRTDLDDAIAQEHALAPNSRTREQQDLLEASLRRFWDEMDQMWMLASAGQEDEARTLVRTRLNAERSTLNSTVARLLVENSDAGSAGERAISDIYRRVETNLYWFIAAVLITITATGVSVIRFSRRIYERLETVSDERKELAGKVIAVQEDVFRTLARELHDDFGQVLTALGAMLQRAKRRIPEDSPAQSDLREIREVTATTLERVRLMSQMLHPPVLDDHGLEKSIEWYVSQFQKQSGLDVHYEKIGNGPWIGDQVAIHVYRILQEALNNVLRHAKTSEVWVKAEYTPSRLKLTVEDHGVGMHGSPPRSGIGLISMRERAGLLGGMLEFSSPGSGGARVTLTVPLQSGVSLNDESDPSSSRRRS
jgi:signal transduction histidine kinase